MFGVLTRRKAKKKIREYFDLLARMHKIMSELIEDGERVAYEKLLEQEEELVVKINRFMKKVKVKYPDLFR